MINKKESGKIERQIYIKIFNITTRVIYPVVFNEFVYYNQFVIEIYTHIKLIE
jgi:hypothetical protein